MSAWSIRRWGVVIVGLAVLPLLMSAARGGRTLDEVLFPPIEPYESGYLRVSEIHQIYYELCGNPEGTPVLVLHGGPGGQCTETDRRFFDPERFLIVLHDQRGAGRSKPFAELRENTTPNLVADIEHLREKLSLDQICLVGGSWGSTLALAYAEAHPEHVRAMVLRGLWTATEQEVDHWYNGGVGLYFPEEYDKLIDALPPDQEGSIPQRLLKMLQDKQPAVRERAEHAWAMYEMKVAHLAMPDELVAANVAQWDCRAFSLIENYYMANDCFLRPDQLIDEADKLKDIPITVINGRYDVICPPRTAYQFCKRLPKARLVITEQSGHSQYEPRTTEALLEAIKTLE
ncbi:MAG: prolyl aminopeptidase [Phycisphaerae bacterium]|nr:prolyl aminopeptidase [Phycisphaerae bacterium]